ncbi:hypothetical protein [Pseudorhodoferax sp. Leaf267]|uniref:hypothetical protein n=1 Tax=Pseudorhodoferax sp. Leaf267 TaxID=1736316 RepID=UPI000B30FCFC|nr:hypothetical protein [Pseudorhodoferax sp. Leaf267]
MSGCIAAWLLSACGSQPPVPDWQGNAHGALQSAVAATLNGNTRVAEADMARARNEIARTGQPALLARAELVLCAARVASLDLAGCPAYEALAVDAAPAERAYAAYLYGKGQPADVALLPEQHRGVARGGASAAALHDPLARLVAAAVLLQRGTLVPADAVDAAATASAQGWRRPLLAWLGVQLRAAEAAGDAGMALQLQRRIGLAAGTSSP